jgi:hypothetical protein
MSKRQTTIVLKNSNEPNRPLPTSSILLGEALVNTADGIVVFSGASSGSNNWVPSTLNQNYFEVGSNIGKLKIRDKIVYYGGVEGAGLEGKILSGTSQGFVLVDSSEIQGISVFNDDIPVSLSGGKTLGKYLSGQVVPASGKTFEEVMRDIAIEALQPTLTLSLSPSSIPFNTTNPTVTVNYGVVTQSFGATSTEIKLEYSPTVTSTTYTELTGFTTSNMNLTGQNFSHSFTMASGNTSNGLYRLSATDNLGGTRQTTATLFQTQYVPPTVNAVTTVLNGATITNTTLLEFGSNNININFTINRQTPNSVLTSYALLRIPNNGSSTIVPGTDNVIVGGPSSVSTPVFTDSSIPNNSTTLEYIVRIFDSVRSVIPTETSSIRNFNLILPWFFGNYPVSNILPSAQTLLDDFLELGGKRLQFSNTSITVNFTNPSVNLKRWILVPL